MACLALVFDFSAHSSPKKLWANAPWLRFVGQSIEDFQSSETIGASTALSTEQMFAIGQDVQVQARVVSFETFICPQVWPPFSAIPTRFSCHFLLALLHSLIRAMPLFLRATRLFLPAVLTLWGRAGAEQTAASAVRDAAHPTGGLVCSDYLVRVASYRSFPALWYWLPRVQGLGSGA